jgi:hypothetical protein
MCSALPLYNKDFYYMENGVLVETKTLVNSYATTSGTKCAYFPYFTAHAMMRVTYEVRNVVVLKIQVVFSFVTRT